MCLNGILSLEFPTSVHCCFLFCCAPPGVWHSQCHTSKPFQQVPGKHGHSELLRGLAPSNTVNSYCFSLNQYLDASVVAFILFFTFCLLSLDWFPLLTFGFCFDSCSCTDALVRMMVPDLGNCWSVCLAREVNKYDIEKVNSELNVMFTVNKRQAKSPLTSEELKHSYSPLTCRSSRSFA